MSTRDRAGRTRTGQIPVAMEGETRAAAWLRNFRLSGFAFAVLLLVVAALVILAPGLRTFVEQRQEIAQLQGQVSEAKHSVDHLRGEVARWDDPAYVEAQARGRLYYVFPGEVSYLVTGRTTAPTTSDGQPISDDIQTTQVDWVRTLLGSIYAAGTTTAKPGSLTTTPGSGSQTGTPSGAATTPPPAAGSGG